MKVKQYSPYVINFEIVAKGNLKQKTKLSDVWDKIEPFHVFNNPMTKNKKKNKITKPKASSVIYDVKGLVD